MNQKDLEKIKKNAEEFFNKMTFEVEIEPPTISKEDKLKKTDASKRIGEEETFTVSLNVKSNEPQILIGERGQTLIEIQHLLKAILKRKIGSEKTFYVNLDVNDYKKKKIEYLKELSQSLADEVALTKRERVLSPMPAYERRIIHLELAGREDVTTESIGQEPERKIIIRPHS